MPTLTQVSTEHRERLMTHVDALPGLADEVGTTTWSALRRRIAEEQEFYAGTLVPHMNAVEAGIHQELDRLLSCRIAMEPIEREHAEVRKLVERLGALAAENVLTAGHELELNRVLIKLYSILKVHLREESRYVPILEHNLDPEKIDALVASMDHIGRVEL